MTTTVSFNAIDYTQKFTNLVITGIDYEDGTLSSDVFKLDIENGLTFSGCYIDADFSMLKNSKFKQLKLANCVLSDRSSISLIKQRYISCVVITFDTFTKCGYYEKQDIHPVKTDDQLDTHSVKTDDQLDVVDIG
jgi:hypothetical protein